MLTSNVSTNCNNSILFLFVNVSVLMRWNGTAVSCVVTVVQSDSSWKLDRRQCRSVSFAVGNIDIFTSFRENLLRRFAQSVRERYPRNVRKLCESEVEDLNMNSWRLSLTTHLLRSIKSFGQPFVRLESEAVRYHCSVMVRCGMLKSWQSS